MFLHDENGEAEERQQEKREYYFEPLSWQLFE